MQEVPPKPINNTAEKNRENSPQWKTNKCDTHTHTRNQTAIDANFLPRLIKSKDDIDLFKKI